MGNSLVKTGTQAPVVANDAITAAQIATGAVGTLELADACITSAKMASSFYSEGTFTPRFEGSTGSIGTYAASTQTGAYTRIGNRVFFNLFIGLTSKGSWTGSARIRGLPITAANRASGQASVAIGYIENITYSASKVQLIAYVAINDTQIVLLETQSAAAIADLPMANISNTTSIMISGHYEI